MKKILVLSLVIGLFVITGLGYVFFKPKHESGKNGGYAVAILTPVSHPALERIEQGFKDTLSNLVCNNTKVTYKTYNAQGKKTLMRAQVDEALNGDFDVIVTLGAGATLMMHERINKAGKKTPHVFAAVAKPERNGIVQNSAITGVKGEYNPVLQVKALFTFKPAIKNVLVVYDPSQTPELINDVAELNKLLQARGCTLRKVEITGVADVSTKVPGLLDGVQALIVLADNTVVSGIDALIKQCNQRGITLVASDLDSGIKGAALAVGVCEESYGQLAAHQAFEILVNKKPAQALPFCTVDKYYVQINTKTMLLQQLTTPQILDTYVKEDCGEKEFSAKDVVCVHLS